MYTDNEFRFPSNGKAHPKAGSYDEAYLRHLYVSIPFKRERVSKVRNSNRWRWTRKISFDSLQTGKHIARSVKKIRRRRADGFRFPSNGKAHRKVSKVTGQSYMNPKFPFLSNGNADPKPKRSKEPPYRLSQFPFPSNGKVHRKPWPLQDQPLRSIH